MKYQQVSVDFVNMVFTAFSYLALAGAAWIFLRLLQACFWLPRHLRKQNDVQSMLQEKVDSYEKYLLECEEKEKAEESGEITTEPTDDTSSENADENAKVDTRTKEEKWKERRECLEMLKRELKRVQNGGDIYDWDYLLEEDDKPEDEKPEDEKQEDDTINELDDEKISKKEELCLSEVDCEIVDDTTKLIDLTEEKKDK